MQDTGCRMTITDERKEMKKAVKKKTVKAAKKEKPDVIELVTKLREQMAILEMKVDVLIERLTIKPNEAVHQTLPPNVPGPSMPVVQTPKISQNNGRMMHEAVCADCGKNCEVPFKPREGRAVFCKGCFSKRRSSGAPKPAASEPPAGVKPVPPAVPAPKEPERKKWGNIRNKSTVKKAAGKKRASGR
jgi:CxxC-x17-CxxC domain-containing protein